MMIRPERAVVICSHRFAQSNPRFPKPAARRAGNQHLLARIRCFQYQTADGHQPGQSISAKATAPSAPTNSGQPQSSPQMSAGAPVGLKSSITKYINPNVESAALENGLSLKRQSGRAQRDINSGHISPDEMDTQQRRRKHLACTAIERRVSKAIPPDERSSGFPFAPSARQWPACFRRATPSTWDEPCLQ